MMKHQVSRSDYQRCVDAGACRPVAGPMPADAAHMPVVGVNWSEANAYAAWLSGETGRRYRLPTDAEWAYAAGSLFFDPTVVADGDAANPAARWIAAYESESAIAAPPDRHPRRFGAFGTNEHGLDDIRGNVWDWTSTCFTRNATSDGVTATSELCGVRVVEGRHRAYLTDFIREPRGGSCSVGAPPANLGIRLVRDDPDGIADRIVRAIQDVFAPAT
jgi:formylglycine-generating enzyme required for sulfatase activity